MDQKIIKIMEKIFDADLSGKSISECNPSTIEQWDSFSFLTLILSIEEEFGIRFSPDEMDNMYESGDAIMNIISHRL